MNSTINGRPDDVTARALSNQDLAAQLDGIRLHPRNVTAALRDALLNEAARRLRWPDAYEAH